MEISQELITKLRAAESKEAFAGIPAENKIALKPEEMKYLYTGATAQSDAGLAAMASGMDHDIEFELTEAVIRRDDSMSTSAKDAGISFGGLHLPLTITGRCSVSRDVRYSSKRQ